MSSSPRTRQRLSDGCDATQAQSFSSSPFLCHAPESVQVVPQAAGQPYQARMLSSPLTLQRGAHWATHAQSFAGSFFLCHAESSWHGMRTCVEIKFYGAFALNRRVDLHAIDAPPARWRGDAGSSPLDGASTAASSPRNDLVKNCRVHR